MDLIREAVKRDDAEMPDAFAALVTLVIYDLHRIADAVEYLAKEKAGG
jgi:hypothetical protein